ncbi:MAG TPA: hypothetical protein EYO99_00310 [Candidatus Marinimicrobia bacterium]|nr:hypothetical protein [Candidatus Neomarinimicrobiota bacterium]
MISYLQYEALDIAGRRKMARRMSRLAKRSDIKMKKKRALRKRAGISKLQKRARKKAKMAVIKKFSGQADYSELSLQQRMMLDKRIVQKKQALINKIAKKMIPQLRKKESERIAKIYQTKS